MFLADGFEEVEALAPLDIMRRAGLQVLTVGIGGRELTGAHGIKVTADCDEDMYFSSLAKDIEKNSGLEMIFLPGGMPGTLNLANSRTVEDAIKTALGQNAYIAAICAAPSILGDMGLLNGKNAVCYPGFEDRLKGASIQKENIVLDGKLLTARGMGVAVDMGLKIVEMLISKEKADALRHACIAD